MQPTNYKYLASQFLKYSAFCVMAFFFAIACKEEERDLPTETYLNDPRMQDVDKVIQELQKLDEDVEYGTIAGTYPASSKSILQQAISTGNKFYLLLKYGPLPAEEELTTALVSMNEAKTKFLDTKLKEDMLLPAELFVDGLNNGYIDFGNSSEYGGYGERGKQRFTIETWVKLTQINGFGAVLTTFYEDGGQRVRQGWMINHFDNSRLRMSYSMSAYDNMLEPGIQLPMPQSRDTWVHFATVYSDEGFDGERDQNGTLVVGKVYKNGVLDSRFTKRDPSDVYSSTAARLRMTAFAEIKSDGGLDRRISGYLKDVRIWKSAKTESEIQALMNKSTVVTGKESDLAAAWDFSMTVRDDMNIKDLTGRHTAKVEGSHRWEVIE